MEVLEQAKLISGDRNQGYFRKVLPKRLIVRSP